MKFLKKAALVVCIFFALVCVVSCTETEPAASQETTDASAGAETKTGVNIATLAGPTGMGMVELMEENENESTGNDYAFTIVTAPDEIVGLLTSKKADIAAIPANLAATLYAKTNGGVQMAAINTLGVLYIVQTGTEISSVSDLEGKRILASGQGSTPEYLLNYILAANDLTDKVTVEYYSEHSEVVSHLAADEAGLALLPEPYVTIAKNKVEGLSVALDLNTEWENACAITGDTGVISMGCVVVRTEFAAENPKAVNTFLDEYYRSIAFVNSNTEEAAALVAKYGIMADETLAEAALPNCNIVYIDGAIMKESIADFFNVLYEAEPASVGGALPDDGFYYIK